MKPYLGDFIPWMVRAMNEATLMLKTTEEERATLTALAHVTNRWTLIDGDDIDIIGRLLRDFDEATARAEAEKASKIELAVHLDKVIALAAAEVKRANEAEEKLKQALRQLEEK